eukprot:scaffold4637_cov128-Cylindrotheca_fusiformis.AAC.33
MPSEDDRKRLSSATSFTAATMPVAVERAGSPEEVVLEENEQLSSQSKTPKDEVDVERVIRSFEKELDALTKSWEELEASMPQKNLGREDTPTKLPPSYTTFSTASKAPYSVKDPPPSAERYSPLRNYVNRSTPARKKEASSSKASYQSSTFQSEPPPAPVETPYPSSYATPNRYRRQAPTPAQRRMDPKDDDVLLKLRQALDKQERLIQTLHEENQSLRDQLSTHSRLGSQRETLFPASDGEQDPDPIDVRYTNTSSRQDFQHGSQSRQSEPMGGSQSRQSEPMGGRPQYPEPIDTHYASTGRSQDVQHDNPSGQSEPMGAPHNASTRNQQDFRAESRPRRSKPIDARYAGSTSEQDFQPESRNRRSEPVDARYNSTSSQEDFQPESRPRRSEPIDTRYAHTSTSEDFQGDRQSRRYVEPNGRRPSSSSAYRTSPMSTPVRDIPSPPRRIQTTTIPEDSVYASFPKDYEMEEFSRGTRFVAKLAMLMRVEIGQHAPLSVIIDRHWDELFDATTNTPLI